MILGFKPQFKQPILDGTKIHTIRVDSHKRWKAGRKIHYATGVRTKDYKQFKEGWCVRIQDFEVIYTLVSSPSELSHTNIEYDGAWFAVIIKVDGMLLGLTASMELAINDGFYTYKEFLAWFNKDLNGRIIHWTDYRY